MGKCKTANIFETMLTVKQNLSLQYSMMLLSQTFSRMLILWDREILSSLSPDLVNQIPVILFQLITRTLLSEDSKGSWSQTPEITAYAVLTLVSASVVPWTDSIQEEISAAVTRAKGFLTASHNVWRLPAYIWIEKVTYASPAISHAYCLAAMHSQSLSHVWSPNFTVATDIHSSTITKFSHFFSRIPMFAHWDSRKLGPLLVESRLYLPRLRALRYNIFPQQHKNEDKYLEYIPFTWLGCNALSKPVHSKILWEMIHMSMLTYQVDEYMEAVVGFDFEHHLQPVRELIDRLCLPLSVSTLANGTNNHRLPDSIDVERNRADGESAEPQAQTNTTVTLTDIERVLTRFTTYVLSHAKVLQAPASAQNHLRRELRTYLLAHVAQIEDNTRLTEQASSTTRVLPFASSQQSYFAWVRSTSADHTSCPFAFAFFACLIAPEPQKACFASARQTYLAQDVCRHLATMCRQYNDYGSVARDRAENNLNSVNFPEFCARGDGASVNTDGGSSESRAVEASDDDDRVSTDEETKKSELMWLAEYERECLELALGRLRVEVPETVMNAVELFVRVTDLYGQIYVARDISSRIK